MVDPIPSTSIRSLQPDTQKDRPEKVLEAAQQFEALLIGKLLEQARESATKGSLCGEEDQAGEQAISFANQQMADALSRCGGFGLARMVTGQVSRTAGQTPVSNDGIKPSSQKIPVSAKRQTVGAD